MRPSGPAVLLSVALALSLAGCGEPGASTGAAPERITLALHLEKGRSYPLRMEMDMDIVQTVGGRESTTRQSVGMDISTEVEGVAPGGDMNLRYTFDELRMKAEGPGGPREFDTATATPPVPLMFRPLMALRGQSISITTTRLGKVTAVGGMTALLERMMDSLTEGEEGTPPAALAVIREQLRKQFGDESMRQMLSRATGYIPPSAVGTGDTWNVELVLLAPYPMQTDTAYTLGEVRGESVTIGARGTVKPAPGEAVVEMGPVRMRVDLTGTQEGSFEVDRESGWLIRGEVTQSMKGTMTALGAGPGETDMVIPMTLKGRIRFLTAP